jgi:membrane protein YqaA with SNARE-associated domain
MEAIGFLVLFASSFLAATVVPFSSEAVLAAMLLNGGDPFACLVVATVGNTLGGMTGYGLGRWGRRAFKEKRSELNEARQQRWLGFVEHYGSVAALGCWLPGVGDFIAVALGALNTRWLPTLVWMAIGKVARYAVVVGVIPAIG